MLEQEVESEVFEVQGDLEIGADLAPVYVRRDGTYLITGGLSGLGLEVADWDESLEPVIANRDASSAFGPVPAGSIAGVLQVARARANGRTSIELRFLAGPPITVPPDVTTVVGVPAAAHTSS